MAQNGFDASILKSDIIRLTTRGSSELYNVHESLLEAKGGNIKPGNFQEGRNKLYEFEETPEFTLARFVQWMYTNDYPSGPSISQYLRRDGNPKDEPNSKQSKCKNRVLSQPKISTKSAGYLPLLTNAYVYIFADAYAIAALKSLARDKLLSEIKELSKPSKNTSKLPIVELLVPLFKLCFGLGLPDDDALLSKLGHYAAWCLPDLLSEQAFLEVLPQMANHIAKFVIPAATPPWECRQESKSTTWKTPVSEIWEIETISVAS